MLINLIQTCILIFVSTFLCITLDQRDFDEIKPKIYPRIVVALFVLSAVALPILILIKIWSE
jgi:hypothetical protein